MLYLPPYIQQVFPPRYTSVITAYYLPGIGFVRPATDTRAFHEENAHSSTLAITDNAGVRQSRYLYDGYGLTCTVSQALWTPQWSTWLRFP